MLLSLKMEKWSLEPRKAGVLADSGKQPYSYNFQKGAQPFQHLDFGLGQAKAVFLSIQCEDTD